jgi:hypothetical protein
MRPRAIVTALTAIVAMSLGCSATAQARQWTASSGDVQATLDYGRFDDFRFRAGNLKIVRGGQTLFDEVPTSRPCDKSVCAPVSLKVLDLDGDGEPEVLYTGDSGGTHCCIVAQVYWLLADKSGYSSIAQDFGEAGYQISDLDRDGRAEFVSADSRFARFRRGSGAAALPLAIWRYDRVAFADVTSHFPRLLRRDVRGFWNAYLKLRADRHGAWLPQLAAWTADEYRLGRRASALRVLRREVSRGFLRGTTVPGLKFIRFIDRYLAANGYR